MASWNCRDGLDAKDNRGSQGLPVNHPVGVTLPDIVVCLISIIYKIDKF
jgi:hypothetical protein